MEDQPLDSVGEFKYLVRVLDMIFFQKFYVNLEKSRKCKGMLIQLPERIYQVSLRGYHLV